MSEHKHTHQGSRKYVTNKFKLISFKPFHSYKPSLYVKEHLEMNNKNVFLVCLTISELAQLVLLGLCCTGPLRPSFNTAERSEFHGSKLDGGKKGGITALSFSLGSRARGAPFRSWRTTTFSWSLRLDTFLKTVTEQVNVPSSWWGSCLFHLPFCSNLQVQQIKSQWSQIMKYLIYSTLYEQA